MASWGDWLGAWKAEEGQVDLEQERLTRQAAAFGAEAVSKLKDLNVLIIGCKGIGVETAKNLILSNVGSVTVWDPEAARQEDLGSNFYLSAGDIGKPRATSALAQLKSLNPYCKVEALAAEEAALPGCLLEANVLSTGKPFAVVIVTEMLRQETVLALNAEARAKGIAFIFAVTSGVTSSIFSDFGASHVITDSDGEPTQMLAMAGAEVVKVEGPLKVDGAKEGDRVLVITLASDHSLSDGDLISLDDMRGELEGYTGKTIEVKRFSLISPTDAKVDVKSVETKELLKAASSTVIDNFSKQLTFYRSEFETSGKEGKLKTSEKNIFNRIVLVLPDSELDIWGSYQSGGLVNSMKKPVTKDYDSLEKTLTYTPNPQMVDQEAFENGIGTWVHIALAAAWKFFGSKGRWPGLHSEKDADEFVALAKGISDERKGLDGSCWFQGVCFGFPSGEPLEDMGAVEAKLKRYSLLFETELTGFCAFLGGLVAQEALKKTGKFTPLEQWAHHDDTSLCGYSKGITGPYEPRYTYQTAVLGSEAMSAVKKQNIFLVGCGALGCEYMKGLALMGACTDKAAKLIVTDMDTIEVSNLSRQFLFRQTDVGTAKSTSAARVVKGWNPDLQVEALEKGVGDTSEDYFDDAFWSPLSLCWNALDNVKARKYTDNCCLWYGLPLLESGTLGTKTNSDVFIPKLTQSYSDGVEDDSNETQIAMCTLRSFPYLPLHCIEFAKQAMFSDYMEFAPQQYSAFVTDKAGFFEQLESMGDAEKFKALTMIKNYIDLQKSGAVDFNACIRVAFNHYCKDFVISIRDLVHTCDENENASGKPFWTGTKRRPTEAPWNAASPPGEALEYLYATANCYAYIWGLDHVRNRAKFEQLVKDLKLQVPEWSAPGGDAKVDEGDDAEDKVDPEAIEGLKGDLYGLDTTGLKSVNVHDFEKDDDANFHIDFLTVGTNLRARNYDIKQSERATVKVTAGRIIPALATTTAMICGLVDVEFLKLATGLHKDENAIDQFYNANINLAVGLQAMNLFRPDPSIKKKTNFEKMPEYTTWDQVDIDGDISVKALVEGLQQNYGVTVSRVFPANNDKVAIFDSADVAKQNWKLEMTEDGKLLVEPEAEVFTQWPQLRMAKQMLNQLPPGGNARKNFENSAQQGIKSLQKVKATFSTRYEGNVSATHAQVARPADDKPEDQKYFDAVYSKRPYIALGVHVKNSSGEEADFPLIRYKVRK